MNGRWVSAGVCCASTILIGGFLLYAQGAGLIFAKGTVSEIFIISACVGVVLGMSHAIWMGRYQTEMDRLASHIDAMANSSRVCGLPRLGLGLDRIVQAVNRLGVKYHEQIAQLASKRRELEVQVRLADAERQHAEAILNAISDAVVVTDSFNEVAMANAAAAQILDFDMESSLHRSVDRVVRDRKLVNLIKDSRQGRLSQLPRQIEHDIQGKNGTSTYEVTLSAIDSHGSDDFHGAEMGVVAVLRDVTRQKQIAEMKSDFVASVSHELKTPLSSIKAYVEMLVDGEANDEQTRAEFYNIIQGETNRLQRLIDNILNISRIESGVVKVQREYCVLAEILKDVIDVMQPQARAKQITLIEDSLPMVYQVFADRDMIWQASLNLIGNAVKYTPEGGKVTVGMHADEKLRTISVYVRDTGLGIPKEAMPLLFNKFYRVSSHKKIAKGTGLGLNLVKHIIETVHDGKVTVQSKVNCGSEFRYTLPMADKLL